MMLWVWLGVGYVVVCFGAGISRSIVLGDVPKARRSPTENLFADHPFAMTFGWPITWPMLVLVQSLEVALVLKARVHALFPSREPPAELAEQTSYRDKAA